MKKLIAVSVLFTLLATAAFAQFRANLLLDFFPEAFTMTNATGDWTSVGNANDAAYFGEGRRDLFTSQTLFSFHRLFLDLNWASPDQNAVMHTRISLRQMLDGGNSLLATNQGRDASLLDVIEGVFEDWHFRGNAGMFTAFLGNTVNRGVAGSARFVDAGSGIETQWINRYVMSNMGFVLPGDPHAGHASLLTEVRHANQSDQPMVGSFIGGGGAGPWSGGFFDVHNIGTWGNNNLSGVNRPYFMLTTRVLPGLLTIDLAGDMSNFFPGTGTSAEPLFSDSESYTRFGFGGRAMFDLVDLVSLDLVYRIHGGDPQTSEYPIGAQPDALGRTTHVVALAARLNLIDALGITVGYNIMVNNFEDGPDQNVSTRSPILHGIDLRFNFNAIDRLVITLNNNFSFSTFRGTNDADVNDLWGVLGTHGLTGIVGTSGEGRDIRQNYFGMHNILGVRFSLTDTMAVNLHLMNTMRRFHLNAEDFNGETATRFRNQFIGQAVAEYGLTTNVRVGGGLGFIFNHTSLDRTGGGDANYSVGTFTFSVPLRIMMTF